ncbi:MAG: ABC transporter ATP-binding protein [Acidobacteriia bacterium]|nr:ABC transporter ATP-binding protein [Terriglobia bacterium]
MPSSNGPVLDVRDLVCGYGGKEVLHGVSVGLAASEVVAIVGHNGAGKSTLLKAIFGLIPANNGSLFILGQQGRGFSPRELLRLGCVYVPQGGRVFTGLTVRENLELAAITIRDGRRMHEAIESVVSSFPVIGARADQRAGTLSGGEKQMLALGMALVLSPRVLLLDEPSLGLSPPAASEAIRKIQSLSRSLGTAVLIVEQKVREVLAIASRAYVIRCGEVTYSGLASELVRNAERLRSVFW